MSWLSGIGSVLIICGAVSVALAVMLMHKIDVERKEAGILFLLCICASMWTTGFGMMTLCRNFEMAYIGRLVGLIGVYGFIVWGIRFMMSFGTNDEKWAIHLWWIDCVWSVACLFFVTQKSKVTFVRKIFGTSYYTRLGAGKYLAYSFIAVNIFLSLFIMIYWRKHCRYQRDIKLVRIFELTEIIVIGLSAFDVIHPALHIPSIPIGCFGAFFAVIIIYYTASHMNAFSITRENVTRYVYENVHTPIFIMDENSNILMLNQCAEKFFQLDSQKEEYSLSDLFEIGKKDAKNYVSKIMAGLSKESCVLVAKKNQAICEVGINVIFDKYKEPICNVAFVTDVTKEQQAMQKLETMRDSLECELEKKTKQVEGVALQAITTIANFIDSKEEYTSGHSTRVAKYAKAIAKELGWSEEEVANLHYIALLHDIGKIGVPYDILNKPSSLTDEEYAMIKKHTLIGGEILRDIHSVEHVDVGALYHHERYDGKGYPSGLKGNDIPLVARIIAIADSFDAMTSNRRYRSHLSTQEVREELEKNAGKQFDPYLTSVFLKMIDEGIVEPLMQDQSVPEFSTLFAESNQLLAKIMEGAIANADIETQHDYLTKLWNRITGEKYIKEYLKEADGALFVVQVNNFNYITDNFGRQTGDHCLQILAEALQNNSNEHIACRMTADTCLLFLKDVTSVEEVRPIAEGILYNYSSRIDGEIVQYQPTISIGIALSIKEGNDYENLFRCADRALYHSRQMGKGSYSIYKKDEVDENQERLNLERITYVLKHKERFSGAFQIEYQEFMRMCDLVERFTMRNNQSVQLVLFTFHFEQMIESSGEKTKDLMKNFERVITSSLRGVDVCTQFSGDQMLIILVDTENKGVEVPIKRIMERFEQKYPNEYTYISYEHAAFCKKANSR